LGILLSDQFAEVIWRNLQFPMDLQNTTRQTPNLSGENIMESKTEMLARHARELAELENRWWEEWFTADPVETWITNGNTLEYWFRYTLPQIIRKREKIWVTIYRTRGNGEYWIKCGNSHCIIDDHVAVKIAGRPLAHIESVEI
jgi:hypothetical protein